MPDSTLFRDGKDKSKQGFRIGKILTFYYLEFV